MLLPSELKSAQPRDCGICCDSNMKGTEGPLAGPALPPSAQMKEKVGMEEWMDRREIKGRFLSLSLSRPLGIWCHTRRRHRAAPSFTLLLEKSHLFYRTTDRTTEGSRRVPGIPLTRSTGRMKAESGRHADRRRRERRPGAPAQKTDDPRGAV